MSTLLIGKHPINSDVGPYHPTWSGTKLRESGIVDIPNDRARLRFKDGDQIFFQRLERYNELIKSSERSAIRISNARKVLYKTVHGWKPVPPALRLFSEELRSSASSSSSSSKKVADVNSLTQESVARHLQGQLRTLEIAHAKLNRERALVEAEILEGEISTWDDHKDDGVPYPDYTSEGEAEVSYNMQFRGALPGKRILSLEDFPPIKDMFCGPF